MRFRRNHPRAQEVREEIAISFLIVNLRIELSYDNLVILYFRNVAEGISNRSAWPQIQERLVSMVTGYLQSADSSAERIAREPMNGNPNSLYLQCINRGQSSLSKDWAGCPAYGVRCEGEQFPMGRVKIV